MKDVTLVRSKTDGIEIHQNHKYLTTMNINLVLHREDLQNVGRDRVCDNLVDTLLLSISKYLGCTKSEVFLTNGGFLYKVVNQLIDAELKDHPQKIIFSPSSSGMNVYSKEGDFLAKVYVDVCDDLTLYIEGRKVYKTILTQKEISKLKAYSEAGLCTVSFGKLILTELAKTLDAPDLLTTHITDTELIKFEEGLKC